MTTPKDPLSQRLADDIGEVSAESSSAASGRTLGWIQALDAVSLFYVLLPTFIFLVGYLKPFIGWPVALLLAAGAFLAWRDVRSQGKLLGDAEFTWQPWRMLGISLLVFFVVACTGVGGFTFKFFDHSAYDCLLKDFSRTPWPVAYKEAGPDGSPLALVMYTGYWLPSAVMTRLLGWTAGYYFNYFWISLGVLLMVIWYMRIVGKVWIGLALLFLLFGGMDILGRFFTEGGPAAAKVGLLDYLSGVFWWSESRGWLDHWASGYLLTDPTYAPLAGGVFFRFYSPLSFIVDGPYHLIPGGLICMMIIHDLWRRQSASRVMLLWTSLPLGSLFVAFGILPFVGVGIWEHKGRKLFTLSNLTALPAVAILFSYFSSITPNGRVSGWIWEYQDVSATWWILLLHILVEFGILALCIPILQKQGRLPHFLWLLGALCFFLLAPWLRIGEYNDFATKIIIPAQFVLIIWLSIGISDATSKSEKIRGAMVLLILMVGALGPLGTIFRALEFGMHGSPPPITRIRQFNEIEPKALILQGKADTNKPFWRYLAKPVIFRNTEPNFATLRWDFKNLQESIDYWIFFVDSDKRVVTDKGLLIETLGNKPILRRDDVNLDTRKIGMVRIDADILVDGAPSKDAAIVVQWSTLEQTETNEDEWPFQRWHANQALPIRNVVSTNSYWRGTVKDIAFYLRAPKDDQRPYRVLIREIEFLER